MTLLSAIAAHRFGLGEASLEVVGASPQAWLNAQIGPADPAEGPDLRVAERMLSEIRTPKKSSLKARSNAPDASMPSMESPANEDKQVLRQMIAADVRSRMMVAVQTQRPFAERLFRFWSNHFTVSVNKGSVRGLAGVYEREAIRPHIAGRFEDLLWAAITHPAMLRYLDNHLSAGPQSQAVAQAARRAQRSSDASARPRLTGLNENLAREVLELHTLGAQNARGPGGYTQSDVTALAKILTGWRSREGTLGASREPFDVAWHEPGPKRVLGRSYPEGPSGLRQFVRDVSSHPSTAHFISLKLARHFVADQPPEALVQRLAANFIDSSGQLTALYRTLVNSPEVWAPAPQKLKTPEEFVVSSARLVGLGSSNLLASPRAAGPQAGPLLGALRDLKQVPHTAPSPAGWSDIADDWLGPEAIWKRLEWATRWSDRLGRTVDARALARQALGAALTEATLRQVERAADGSQALALLLMSPEWQRR